MNRLAMYLAFTIAASDVLCFSVFMLLPTLDIESSTGNQLGSVVIGAGLILAVISVLVVSMQNNYSSRNDDISKSLSALRKFSVVILISFALFVFLYLANVFREGI
jgi:hypothetical protein